MPVQNRAGAAGEIGNALRRARRAGRHTLLMALSSLAILPEAARLFDRAPAYALDQLHPVALFTADPTVLAVPADAPWRTLEDFLADAKRPAGGDQPIPPPGNYSALHVPMAMLTAAAGIDLLHVPFQGGAPALTALLGGQVQALATGPGPITAACPRRPAARCWRAGARNRAGRLRERADPASRAASPSVEFYIWAGVFAPAATPAPVLAAAARRPRRRGPRPGGACAP